MNLLRRGISVPAIAFVLLLVAWGGAGASVFYSPHDLYEQGYLLVQEELKGSNPQCLVCHPSPTDSRPLIWDRLPASLVDYGISGNICAGCHDGVSIVDRNVDAGLTVFHPDSHGFDPGHSPPGTDLSSTGLAYVPGERLGCVLCHDPHLPNPRPFLRVPVEGLCVRCHQNREHKGYGNLNATGNHPVSVEPYDRTEGPSPIEVDPDFMVPFPAPYPITGGITSKTGHWTLGGHLTYGSYGRIECTTCHAFHGLEGRGPLAGLLSKHPVRKVSDEFCEGCHRGKRGDNQNEPPYPNPGGTLTGRTYHPADDDEANGVGWNPAIADTVELKMLIWGDIDPESDQPFILCTTCHTGHNGMENSPALVRVPEEAKDEGVDTFCEICHRDPPEGHHGYENGGMISPEMSQQITSNQDTLGRTYGEAKNDRVYCSLCHRAHNAGYDRTEKDFIPLLVDVLSEICINCHPLGVSHFMGDPTLPSTYEIADPPLYREAWPQTGMVSRYEGEGEMPYTITCLSCHYLSPPPGVDLAEPNKLLAPAGEETEWMDDYPYDYLCVGCHHLDSESFGQGHTHPLMEADYLVFPNISMAHLLPDEIQVTYTPNGKINCHSCHVTHNALPRGGVYILKVVDGENTDPKAIHPKIDFTRLCHSCHPEDEY